MYHIFFLCLSTDGPLGQFHDSVTVNSVVINMGVQVTLLLHVDFDCFGDIARSGIAGSRVLFLVTRGTTSHISIVISVLFIKHKY